MTDDPKKTQHTLDIEFSITPFEKQLALLAPQPDDLAGNPNKAPRFCSCCKFVNVGPKSHGQRRTP